MRPATGAREDSVSEDVRIEVERPVRADVAALLRESLAMMAGLYPPESCHGLELSSYERPEVTLFVARSAGVAVACGACQLHDDGSAEVKSMFVTPAARGRVSALRLETGVKQLAAIRLYETAGFRRRGPFGSYTDDPLSVFMEKPV
jgi:putative acetyltransferase